MILHVEYIKETMWDDYEHEVYNIINYTKRTEEIQGCSVMFFNDKVIIHFSHEFSDRLIIDRKLLVDIYWIGYDGQRIKCGDEYI